MFTGIVEALGQVRSLEMTERGARLRVEAPLEGFDIGDSVAVNGVCLTVVEHDTEGFSVDVVPETLQRTNLGLLSVGDAVDLERPLRSDGRFDGHIVQGHVDGVGEIRDVIEDDDGVRMRIGVGADLARYIAEKGSIAVDGVSLTVTKAGDDWFEVALIPHTLAVTVLGRRTSRDSVNLEVDIVAKYVERLWGGRR